MPTPGKQKAGNLYVECTGTTAAAAAAAALGSEIGEQRLLCDNQLTGKEELLPLGMEREKVK